MKSTNPFHLVQDTEGYTDFEAYHELPPFPDGRERSVVVRLTLNKDSNEAYPTLTYETEGSHMSLQDTFSEDIFREIVGLEPSKARRLEIQNAELLSALRSIVNYMSDDPNHYTDMADYREAQQRVKSAEEAIRKATTNS